MNQPPDSTAFDDNPYRGPATIQEPVSAGRRKHSRLGIYSILTALFGVALMVVIFLAVASAITTNPGQQTESTGLVVILGLSALGAAICSIVSIVLGVACLSQKNCETILGFWGLLLGSLLALALSGILLLGFTG